MAYQKKELYYIKLTVDHMEMLDYFSDEERGIILKHLSDYFRGIHNRDEIVEDAKIKHANILPILATMLTAIDKSTEKYKTTCENRSKRKNKDTSDTTTKPQKKETETNVLSEEQDEKDEIFEECKEIYLESTGALFEFNEDVTLAKILNQKQLAELIVCLYLLGCKSLVDLYEHGVCGFLDEISNTGVKVTISSIKSLCKDECLKEDFDTLTDYENEFKKIKKILETTKSKFPFAKT